MLETDPSPEQSSARTGTNVRPAAPPPMALFGKGHHSTPFGHCVNPIFALKPYLDHNSDTLSDWGPLIVSQGLGWVSAVSFGLWSPRGCLTRAHSAGSISFVEAGRRAESQGDRGGEPSVTLKGSGVGSEG